MLDTLITSLWDSFGEAGLLRFAEVLGEPHQSVGDLDALRLSWLRRARSVALQHAGDGVAAHTLTLGRRPQPALCAGGRHSSTRRLSKSGVGGLSRWRAWRRRPDEWVNIVVPGRGSVAQETGFIEFFPDGTIVIHGPHEVFEAGGDPAPLLCPLFE